MSVEPNQNDKRPPVLKQAAELTLADVFLQTKISFFLQYNNSTPIKHSHKLG
jgi:hypothetical protein